MPSEDEGACVFAPAFATTRPSNNIIGTMTAPNSVTIIPVFATEDEDPFAANFALMSSRFLHATIPAAAATAASKMPAQSGKPSPV